MYIIFKINKFNKNDFHFLHETSTLENALYEYHKLMDDEYDEDDELEIYGEVNYLIDNYIIACIKIPYNKDLWYAPNFKEMYRKYKIKQILQ